MQSIGTKKQEKEFRKKHLIFQIDSNLEEIHLSQDEINQYILKDIVRNNFKKEKESISLMGENLDTNNCRQILQVGTRSQKENVRHLFLADNKLTQLPFEIEDFPNLQWLTLSRNIFSHYEQFSNFKNLRQIIWTQGNIQKIPESFYEMTSLEKLSLAACEITEISSKISELRNLKELQLDKNMINSLPDQIGLCKNLEILNLQQNELSSLNPSLFSLENLITLNLSINQFTQLPKEIGHLKKLKDFDISFNSQLKQIPETIGDLLHLQTFNCSWTGISELPSSISKCFKLKELYFDKVTLSYFPSFLELLPHLQVMSASSVGQGINKLNNLKKLVLADFGMDNLPPLSDSDALEILNVSDNSLSQIQEHSLKSLHLNTLNASRNNITVFPHVGHLKNLSSLDLTSNSITEIPNSCLQDCKNIQILNLGYNQLQTLPSNVSKLHKLSTLELNNNRLKQIFQKSVEQQFQALDTPIWSKLVFVHLQENQLEELPKSLFNSPYLKQFNFAFNKVKKIPSEICRLTRLLRLDGNYNQITQIPPQIQTLQELQRIELSQNQISIIPHFISCIKKLNFFLVDGCPNQTIQCKDWILKNQISISFGNLITKLETEQTQNNEKNIDPSSAL